MNNNTQDQKTEASIQQLRRMIERVEQSVANHEKWGEAMRKGLERAEKENIRAHGALAATLAEMESDRKWFKWFGGFGIGFFGAIAGLIIYGATRINNLESALDSNLAWGQEVVIGMRRDINRNTVDIKDLQKKHGHKE